MNNQNLVPAIFYFENNETFFGLHNPSSHWNGWSMPLISKDSINYLLKILHDGEYQIAKMDGDNVYLRDLSFDDNEADILEPIEIGGKIYYDFSYLGFCFQSRLITQHDELILKLKSEGKKSIFVSDADGCEYGFEFENFATQHYKFENLINGYKIKF